jgi:MFS family permease
MDIELGFRVGDRYSIALLVFFITYFIFEIPSNVVLRKVGAANWLAFLCMSWGLVTFGAGFAKKWTDIVVCRLLLGLFEAVSPTLITFLSPTNGSRASFQDQCKLNSPHLLIRTLTRAGILSPAGTPGLKCRSD